MEEEVLEEEVEEVLVAVVEDDSDSMLNNQDWEVNRKSLSYSQNTSWSNKKINKLEYM